jgi:hypothetical protein
MQKGEHYRVKQAVRAAEFAGKDPTTSGAYATALQEAEEGPSTRLFQVVLVLNIKKPITDMEGKLNRIRAINGVTIISHERSEETMYRGDVVAKVKFHPRKESMRAWTYVNQILVPEINSSRHVPDVSVSEAVLGTLKEIT